jgi:hypothetical protein
MLLKIAITPFTISSKFSAYKLKYLKKKNFEKKNNYYLKKKWNIFLIIYNNNKYVFNYLKLKLSNF